MRLHIAIAVLLAGSFLAPVTAEALYYDGLPRKYITNRRIRKTTKYLRTVELRNRQRGIRRTRTSDADYITTGRSLRQANVRIIRRAPTQTSFTNKTRRLRSPTLRQGQQPSAYSKTPVSRQTQTYYLQGVRYANGVGVPKDLIQSYVWLKFALSDGHPLARDALRIVTRRMTQTQIVRAEELTKQRSIRTLTYDDDRPEKIRDATRQRDLEKLRTALQRYMYYNQNKLPRHLGDIADIEICRHKAHSCLLRADIKFLIPNYLISIPEDPSVKPGDNGTGYYMAKDEHGIILYAPHAEIEEVYVELEL